MSEIVKNSRIYQALRPDHRMLYVEGGIGLIPVILFSIGTGLSLQRGDVRQTIICSLGLVACLLILIPITGTAMRERARYARRFSSLTEEDILRLEEELNRTPEEYGTFCFLREALFIPGRNMLLFYKEIEQVRTSAAPRGIRVDFVTPLDTYHVTLPEQLPEYHRFRREQNAFAARVQQLHQEARIYKESN